MQSILQTINNIKNTWERMKSIITIKNLSSDVPKSFSPMVRPSPKK